MTMIGNFATSFMLAKVGGAEADQNNAHLRSLVSAYVYAALTFVTWPCYLFKLAPYFLAF